MRHAGQRLSAPVPGQMYAFQAQAEQVKISHAHNPFNLNSTMFGRSYRLIY